MIEQLSPFSRRLIALAILGLVGISALNLLIVPIWQQVDETLLDLDSARTREAVVSRAATAPAPPRGDPLPGGLGFSAPTREAAQALMSQRITELASTGEISIETLVAAPVPGSQPRLAYELAASGSEIAIVKFMAALEQGMPKIRLETWSITAPDAPGSPTKLRARAVALWQQP
jgi:hypothetical protein